MGCLPRGQKLKTKECSRRLQPIRPLLAPIGRLQVGSNRPPALKLRLGNILSPFLPLYGHAHPLHTFPHPLPLHTNERHLKGASSHSKVLAQNQRSGVNKPQTETSAKQLGLGTHSQSRGQKLWDLRFRAPGRSCLHSVLGFSALSFPSEDGVGQLEMPQAVFTKQ